MILLSYCVLCSFFKKKKKLKSEGEYIPLFSLKTEYSRNQSIGLNGFTKALTLIEEIPSEVDREKPNAYTWLSKNESTSSIDANYKTKEIKQHKNDRKITDSNHMILFKLRK